MTHTIKINNNETPQKKSERQDYFDRIQNSPTAQAAKLAGEWYQKFFQPVSASHAQQAPDFII